MHHDVPDQWLLMQGNEVQNTCAGNKADWTFISRDQHDILGISWNIGCKLVFVRFFQKCQVHVLPGFAKIQILGPCINFHRKATTDEEFLRSACCVRVFCYHISQLCRGMTPTYHRAALNETLFERKRFQARFLALQAKTKRTKNEPRRRRHHDSPPPEQQKCVCYCFCVPVLQMKLSKQNFFQAQAYVDRFIIAVCCGLSFCCSLA